MLHTTLQGDRLPSISPGGGGLAGCLAARKPVEGFRVRTSTIPQAGSVASVPASTAIVGAQPPAIRADSAAAAARIRGRVLTRSA